MPVNVVGVISLIFFYCLILAIGLFAAWKTRRRGEKQQDESERAMVGGRDLGLLVLSCTMTATWVGGGYINGTSESVYTPGSGLVWTQAPFGYALSLILGGVLFAKKMRKQGYVTMIDPLQRKLGKRMGGLLFVPSLCGELFWSAAILAALGGSLKVILGVDRTVSVLISTGIAVFYTLIGGLYSVAYTDVIQLFFIVVGLWLSVPFALSHPAVDNIMTEVNGSLPWVGFIEPSSVGRWIDSAFLLVFGGIPWQAYFQRVLASATEDQAQTASFIAAFGCFFAAIPSVIIGAIATTTDWKSTNYGESNPLEKKEQALILPIVLEYLTPVAVSFIGLGAVSAAVMSSADSSLLSASSMFTRNIYNLVFRQKAKDKELTWVLRISILLMGILSCSLALTIESVYALWYLSSDLVYVILFPQLLSVLYFDPNVYGSICAFVIGLFLRLGGGETTFNIKPFINYPGGDNFPYKTFAMLTSIAILLAVSFVVKRLFEKEVLTKEYDILHGNLAFGGRGIALKKEIEEAALDNDEMYKHLNVNLDSNEKNAHSSNERLSL